MEVQLGIEQLNRLIVKIFTEDCLKEPLQALDRDVSGDVFVKVCNEAIEDTKSMIGQYHLAQLLSVLTSLRLNLTRNLWERIMPQELEEQLILNVTEKLIKDIKECIGGVLEYAESDDFKNHVFENIKEQITN